MAVDETLMDSLERDPAGGYLRFYRWDPPTLSFGRFQRPETIIDLERLPGSGIGAVRRASGGKMVFHADEMTFSIGLPIALIRKAAPDAGDFLGWFQAALTPLAEALRALGVPAGFPNGPPRDRDRNQGARHAAARQIHCYAATIGHSLLAAGKKLVGAAGIERNGILAIHGSLPISPVSLPEGLFRRQPEAGVEQGMAFLRDWLSSADLERLPALTLETMRTRLGFPHAEMVSLTDQERNRAADLAAAKYTDLAWPTKP